MKNSKFSLKRLLFVLATLAVCSGVGATDVEFDVKAGNASQYSDLLGQTVNVTLKNRTFTAGEWTGVCFPFSATKEQLDATFGEGKYTIEKFSSIVGTTVNFTIMSTPAVVAGTPYIIRVNTTISDPVFSGVTFASSLDRDKTNIGTQEDNCHIDISSDLSFRGYYFKIDYMYKFVGSKSAPATAYYIKPTGALGNYNTWGEFPYLNESGGYFGASAYFFSSTLGSTNVTLALEQPSNSGSGGEGGESGGGGDTPVDQTTLAYKIANKMQLTNAPTIYITLPDIGDASLDDYLYKRGGDATTAADAPYRRASIKVVATDDTASPHFMESFEEDADNLTIKARGNSTALEGVSDAKRAYRLKFAKGHKHDMINGGYSKRNWVLLANAGDHSLIRNALTAELGKIVGMPFNPGYKFVDLVINNEYRGTYQLTDHPEVDSNRINVNEDTGWYIEFQGLPKMLDFPMCYQGEGPMLLNIKNPEPEDETNTEQCRVIIQMVSDWFQNTWKKGFNINFTNPTYGWRAYNDEESLIKWWIITELTGDYDGMMTAKAYREADGKLFWGPIWDKDLAYGNYSAMSDPQGTLVADLGANGSSIKYFFTHALENDPLLLQGMKAKMDQLVDNGLERSLLAAVDNLAAIVSETNTLNVGRWGYSSKIGEQYHGGTAGYDNYQAYVNQLKDWISKRITRVQSEINRLYTSANTVNGNVVYDVTKSQYDNSQGTNALYTESNVDKLLNITVKGRTFTANEWNAISLPFSVDEAQLKTVFGNGFDIKTFTGVSEDGTKMIFETPSVKSIKTGLPYIIKPSQAVAAEPEFEKVLFSGFSRWDSNVKGEGESITFGKYTLSSLLYKKSLSSIRTIGPDGITLSTPSSSEYNGSIVYVTVADGAVVPTIQFGKDAPVVRTQLTNLPTIYIDTQDGTSIKPSTGDYVQAAIEVMDANGKLTPFVETSEFLQVRGRGKTEWDVVNGKKSYRLKFAKKHKYDLTGAGYTKRNWVLAANAADESMIKNALTKKLGDQLKMSFTPNCCFVDLVVNGEYMGTYTAMDFVEADRENDVSRRVNADEKTGWLLELTNEDGIDKSGDVYLAGTDYTKPWVNIKNPEPDYADTDTEEVKAAAISAVKSPIQSFIDNLWTSTQTSVDRGSLVNWYIASEILGGTQTLSSVYAYKDANDTQLKFGPLWGNELSYQNAGMTDLENSATATGLIVNSASESALRNKLKDLWGSAWFSSAVAARWAKVKDGLADALKNEADELKGVISTSWTKNFTKKASDGAGWTATSTLDSNVAAIKTYIDNRIAYLDRKFALLAANSAVEGDVNGDGEVDVNDLQTLAAHIRGLDTLSYNPTAADVNGDGDVDVNDLQALSKLIRDMNKQ